MYTFFVDLVKRNVGETWHYRNDRYYYYHEKKKKKKKQQQIIAAYPSDT